MTEPTATVVVTGVNGFVGRHLVRELHAHGLNVVGVGLDGDPDDEIAPLLADYFSADLTDRWPDAGPTEAVIHLAGLAAVGPSFSNPQHYLNANSAMVTVLGEHLVASDSAARVVIASSGAIYDPHQLMPLTERADLAFTSPYAVSKVLVENQASYYRSRGLDVVVARPFNHIGSGQGPGFLVPDLEAALRETTQDNVTVRVGDLSTRRDYTDVRDVVRAYRLLATTPDLRHTTYNVCSGRSVAGKDILGHLREGMGIPQIATEVDQKRIRPNDPRNIVGDGSRLRADTGWEPQFTVKDAIVDFLGVR